MVTKKHFIISILILASILRVIAINPGYPPNHPDEPLVYANAARMVINHDLDPHKYDYPILPMQVHAILYTMVFVPLSLIGDVITKPTVVFSNLSNLNNYITDSLILPNALYWGRFVTMLFAVSTVYLTFLIGKKMFGYYGGLVAALLTSVNFRHVLSSILVLNDIPNTFITLLIILVLLHLFDKPARGTYLLLGFLLGIGLSMKYQTFILVPFIVTQIFIAFKHKDKSLRRRLRILFNKDFFLSSFIALIVFILFNIFPLLHFTEWKMWFANVSTRYGIGVVGLKLYPIWFLYNLGIGKVISILVIVGIGLSLLEKQRRSYILIILSLIFCVLLFFTYYSVGGIYVRNFTFIIPLLVLFAAYSIDRICSLFLKRVNKKYYLSLLMIISLLLSYPSLKNSLYQSYFLSKELNSACVRTWMEKNLPAGSRVGILPPVPMNVFDQKKSQWFYYNMKTNFTLPELQNKKIDYLAINILSYQNYFIRWTMQGTNLWDMPVSIFKNTLPGLQIWQLENFTVKRCIKPWPVIDNNFIIVKVPKPIEIEKMKRIAFYSLDSKDSLENWSIFIQERKIPTFKLIKQKKNCYQGECYGIYHQNGLERYKSIADDYANYGTPLFYPSRLQSEAIPIRQGKVYRVKGWVKSIENIIEKMKDGFFRIDFYENKDNISIGKSLAVFTSARIWGDAQWKEVVFEGVAPDSAHFLTVSFQTEYKKNDFLIDEIEVSEGDSKIKDNSYIKAPLDNKIIYPSFIL